ncbi:MAG: hypothetical protein U0795_12240 [Pirellulales bacterium]
MDTQDLPPDVRYGWTWALIAIDIVLFGLAMAYSARLPDDTRPILIYVLIFAHLQMMVLLFVFAPLGIGWRSLLLLASAAGLVAAYSAAYVVALNQESPGVKEHQVLWLWNQRFRENSSFAFALTLAVPPTLLPLRFLLGTMRVAPSDSAFHLSLANAMLGTASIAVALAWGRNYWGGDVSLWLWMVGLTVGGSAAGCLVAILSPHWRLGLEIFGACFLASLIQWRYFIYATPILAVICAHTAGFLYALRCLGYRLYK